MVLERPPKLEMGEAASPVCFELAKGLKKAPRAIAQEIAGSLAKIEGIDRVEVAGGGYLNAFFDRATFWESTQKEAIGERPAGGRPSKERSLLNTPALIRTRPRTLGICAMRYWATRWCVCCGTPVTRLRYRITSTTRECRWPMW